MTYTAGDLLTFGAMTALIAGSVAVGALRGWGRGTLHEELDGASVSFGLRVAMKRAKDALAMGERR